LKFRGCQLCVRKKDPRLSIDTPIPITKTNSNPNTNPSPKPNHTNPTNRKNALQWRPLN